MSWDFGEYLKRRRAFIANRELHHPMFLATTLIFGVTWGFGWFVSAMLLWAADMRSMPLRYGIAFVLAYAMFFLCVRIWCNSVHHDRSGGDLSGDFGGLPSDEGCLVVVAVLLVSMTAAGVFVLVGGFPLLLEVAFEVAFAGTVVRRLSHTQIVGNWAGKLLANTWLHALLALLMLVGLAASLQHAAPGAAKLSEAIRHVWHGAARR